MPVRTLLRFLEWPAWLRLLTTSGYFVALNWMLLAPASTFEDFPEFFPHEDKFVHGAVFLLLAWLARWSAQDRFARGAKWINLLAVLLLYAGAIEALQPILGGAGRQFDWLDMASNVAGVCAGWLMFGAARHRT